MKIGKILISMFLWFLAFLSYLIGAVLKSLPNPIGDGSITDNVCMLGGIIDNICMLGAPLIFFILGVICLLTGLKETPVEAISKQTDRVERRCPKCGRAIPFEANVCPYCGKNFNEFQQNVSKNKCPSCGFIIQPGDIFCGNCGNKIKE